jgi:hypothetical protein
MNLERCSFVKRRLTLPGTRPGIAPGNSSSRLGAKIAEKRLFFNYLTGNPSLSATNPLMLLFYKDNFRSTRAYHQFYPQATIAGWL